MPIEWLGDHRPPVQEEKKSLWDRIGGLPGAAGAVVRGGSGLLSGMGGPIGAIISGGGEALAQMVEAPSRVGEAISAIPEVARYAASDPLKTLDEFLRGTEEPIKRIGVEGAVGAVPGASLVKAGKIGSTALRSGALAGAGELGREWAQGRDIDPASIATHAAIGGGVGAGLAKLFGVLGAKADVPTTTPKQYEIETSGIAQKPAAIRPTKTITAAGENLPTAAPPSAGQLDLPFRYQEGRVPQMSEGPAAPYRSAAKAAVKEEERFLKAEQEAARLEAIRQAREEAGVIPQEPSFRESLSAKTPEGATESMSTRYALPEEAPTEVGGFTGQGRLKLSEELLEPITPTTPRTPAQSRAGAQPIPPPGSPAHDIYQQWKALGRDDKTALKLAAKGRAPRNILDTGEDIAEEVTTTPSVSPSTVPVSESGMPTNVPQRRQADVAPVVGEGKLAKISEGSGAQKTLDELAQFMRGDPDAYPQLPSSMGDIPVGPPQVPKAPFIPPGPEVEAKVPGAAPTISPQTGQPTATRAVQAATQRQEAAAQRKAFAQQNFTPEANQRLDQISEFLRTGARGDARKAAIQEMQSIHEAEMARVSARDQQAQIPPAQSGTPQVQSPQRAAGPVGPQRLPLSSEVEGAPPVTKLPPGIAGGVASEKLQAQKAIGGRGVTLGAGLGGFQEIGDLIQAHPEFATKLVSGAVGAAGGAIIDPFDNPLVSALAGGTLAYNIPNAVAAIRAMGIPSDQLKGLEEALQTPEGTKRVAGDLLEFLPQLQRASYLADANGLPANVVVGPYGSALFGALEHALAGDARGWAALQELQNPLKFIQAIKTNYAEGRLRVEQGELGRAELGGAMEHLPEGVRTAIEFPAAAMTSGDITARNILLRAGFTEDEARKITLTGEPDALRSIANIGRGTDNPLVKFLLGMGFPFRRTPANIWESGLERAPGIGLMYQAFRDNPDPIAQQLAQQGIGLGIGGASAGLGYYLDPETARTVKRYATNLGGQYSLLANAGFAAGQAMQRGESPGWAAASSSLTDLPLPTTRSATELYKFLHDEDHPLPRGFVPFKEQLEGLGVLEAPGSTNIPKPPQIPARFRIRQP